MADKDAYRKKKIDAFGFAEVLGLDPEGMADAFEWLVHAAVRAAFEDERKAEARRRGKAADRRCHNTRLLLEHYHELEKHVAAVSDDISEEIDDAIIHGAETLDIMTQLVSKWDTKVRSLEESAARTYRLLRHVDCILAGYRFECESSPSEHLQRRWRCLHARYIADPVMTTSEIAAAEFVDERTVQRDLKAAISDLGVLLFGADGLNCG